MYFSTMEGEWVFDMHLRIAPRVGCVIHAFFSIHA